MNTIQILDAIEPSWRLAAISGEPLDAIAATLVADAKTARLNLDLSEVVQLLRESASREADDLCRWHITLCEFSEVAPVPEADRRDLVSLMQRIRPKGNWSDDHRINRGIGVLKHGSGVAALLYDHLKEPA